MSATELKVLAAIILTLSSVALFCVDASKANTKVEADARKACFESNERIVKVWAAMGPQDRLNSREISACDWR